MSLKGKVAIVAGATRGAGRGIAIELGAAGATVYVTGRTTRTHRSEYDRPETIEETAEQVAAAGGEGIAVQVDHLVSHEVSDLIARIRKAHGRLDILVNDVWGGEKLFEWNKPVWEHDLDNGLRLLDLGVRTHLITAHHALPLMIRRPGGFLVEMTDGTADYNGANYRNNPFYDLAKTGEPHGLGAREGLGKAWRDLGLPDAGLAAFGDDAGSIRRHRGKLARRDADGAAFRDFRDAALRRPRRRRACLRSRQGTLERAVAVERRSGANLWIHRSRRLATRRLALSCRGSRRR